MLAIKTFEQTGVYDPNNPNQVIREAYTPGGYSSFYFNRVPNDSSLQGLRGLGFSFSTLPSWQQIGIVGAVGAVAGFFAMKKWGATLKPMLRKIPVVGTQFAGLGGRRARRRR